MKKKVKYLLTIATSILLIVWSCSKKEEKVSYPDLKLSSETITTTTNKSITASIIAGSGTYTVNSNDNSKAKATITNNTITITGIAKGTAKITVTDTKTKQTKIITINITINTKPNNSSNGSGGKGFGTHDIKINGHPAIIFVPSGYDPTKPTHLAFRIHGDANNPKAYTFGVNSKTSTVNKFIEEKNWILVSPKTPLTTLSWWKKTTKPYNTWTLNDIKTQADHFLKVLDYMFKHYNLYYDSVYGCGLSGGAEFFTSQFAPLYGNKYNIKMLVVSGGEHPWAKGTKAKSKEILPPSVATKLRWTYIYGSKEPEYLMVGIKRSINYYGSLGIKIEKEVLNGASHHHKWEKEGFLHPMKYVVKHWKKLSE